VERVVDTVVTALLTIAMTAGGGYAIQKIGRVAKQAALEKAARGLPPLTPLARGLARQRSSGSDSH
jgi:hypothetical protein